MILAVGTTQKPSCAAVSTSAASFFDSIGGIASVIGASVWATLIIARSARTSSSSPVWGEPARRAASARAGFVSRECTRLRSILACRAETDARKAGSGAARRGKTRAAGEWCAAGGRRTA